MRAAREAGALIMRQRAGVAVDQKSSNNLVTEADRQSERLIVDIIRDRFPGAGFLGEEETIRRSERLDDLWVIDPIDGTNNYAHGIPLYCVSIAYVQKGEPVIGVVYDPVRDELFSARAGAGAWCNGAPLRVTDSARLEASIVATGFYYERGVLMERTLDAIRRLFEANIRGIRRTGSAALDLCWLAAGRFDAYFEYRLSPWDFAAGMLLVREAGGICDDRTGRRLDLEGTGVIVSNGAVHESLSRTVRWRD
jgi:myo-inositol-1(or 4)-monophosphatase